MEHILGTCPTWKVLTLSRRSLDLANVDTTASGITEERIFEALANLLDPGEVQSALDKVFPHGTVDTKPDESVSMLPVSCVRIYHCAYIESGEGAVKDCQLNLTMLKNVVEAAGPL